MTPGTPNLDEQSSNSFNFRSWANAQLLILFFVTSILICIFVPIFHWVMVAEKLGVHDSLAWRIGVSIPAVILAMGTASFRGWRKWLIEFQTLQISSMIIGMVWITGLAKFHPYYLTACLLGIIGASLTLVTYFQVGVVFAVGNLAVFSFYFFGPHDGNLFPFFYFFSLLTIAGSFATVKARAHIKEYRLRKTLHEALEEVKLEKSKGFAQAQLSFLGELAGNLAHEVNNPLTVFQGSLQMMQTSLAQPDLDRKWMQALIERCNSQIQRLKTLSDNMLYFSGNRFQSKENLTAAELIDIAFDLVRPYGDRFGIEIIREFAVEKVYLDCSNRNVLQALFHPLRNAIEAVAHRELPAKDRWVKIHASIDPAGMEWIVRITDSGHGIAPEIRSRLFSPFVVGGEKKGHIGLGLSTTKELLERAGGRIQYLAHEGNTTFELGIPIRKGGDLKKT